MARHILNPVETLEAGALAELQTERLRAQLDYVGRRSRFYKRRLKESGLKPDDVRDLEDIRKLPFTTKEELRRHNKEFFCVDNRDVVDIGSSTGTTGPPVILPATRKDWDDVVETVKRTLVGVGVSRDDVFQISLAFDQLYSAAPMFDDALKAIGATVVRAGPGNIRRQLEMMRRLGVTCILSTPHFMLMLAEEARRLNLDPVADLNLRLGIFAGECLHTADWQPNELNRRIRELWGMEVYSDYGSMEMLASFVECAEHGGHHVFADHFLVEIIDPETGDPLPPGERGEVVFTHLTRQATPLVRFRQGDVASMCTEPCACGRTSPRIMASIGRLDRMMKIKGAPVYPEQIDEALASLKAVTAYVFEAFTDEQGIDRIRIKAAFDGPRDRVVAEIRKAVKAKTRILPDVVERVDHDDAVAQLFAEGTRKPRTFHDKRSRPPAPGD